MKFKKFYAIKIFGFDLLSYAIKNIPSNLRGKFLKRDIEEISLQKKIFDLTISLGVLHNLKLNEIKHSIYEINRVSKQSYIMVESYRNNRELFNLQCWALTCKAFFDKDEFGFNYFDYKGDYEFIYFE